MPESFDYIIVGSGAAGCVLADRLRADRQHTVVLLEYGGRDQSVVIQRQGARNT